MKTRLEHQYPWLDDRSSWRERLDDAQPPADPGRLGHGWWTLGNEQVFAVRHDPPFTRISALLGPDYARDDDFPGWGAQLLLVRRDERPLAWHTQEAFRIRRTAITGAECTADDVRLLVVDSTPPDWPVIVRTVVVQNTGTQPLSGLRVDVLHEQLPRGEVLAREDGWECRRPTRRLRVLLLSDSAHIDPTGLSLTLPTLAPGEDEQFHVLLLFGHDEESVAVLAAKVARNPDRLLGISYHWWQAWMREVITVVADTPPIGDLLENTTIFIATQQGASGAIPPLISRSYATPVDELAPVQWLLRAGKSSLVARALEARYQETCRRHAFAERLPTELVLPAPAAREPAWERLTPPPAWTAAAVIRAHWEYWRHTGDLALMQRHFHYLRWLVESQPVTADGLVPFGGDEPFHSAFQRGLPLTMQAELPADSTPYAQMRPPAWGAAPAMALVAACEQLADIAVALGEDAAYHRLNTLASNVRDATERTFWLAVEDYYAACRSRVSGEHYRLPHLPTALAPFTTGYAASAPRHAQRGLDESLQYLLDTTGLPFTAPQVPSVPGALPGELLSVLAATEDQRREIVYLATLACAAPGGAYQRRYDLVALPRGPDIPPARPGVAETNRPRDASLHVARPAETAANALGLLDYLLSFTHNDGVLTLHPQLPPGSTHVHIEAIREAGNRLAVYLDRVGDTVRVRLGNAGPAELRASVSMNEVETPAYLLRAGEQHMLTLPATMDNRDLLPTPREFSRSGERFATAPMLVLTVDPDSFANWREQFDAVIHDASMPLSPQALAGALQQNGHRRYDVLYLDLPEAGAAWVGLSDAFWNDAGLQEALATFRDLGGIVTATLFIDSWQVQIAEHASYEVATRHAWMTLPHVTTPVSATSIVPWESAHEEVVELLLYLTDGIDLALEINGEPLWRRTARPEGKRLRVPARLQPGENLFTIHALPRAGHGFGFCLGIRGQLSWNQQRRAA